MGLNEKYAKFLFDKILRGVQELHESGIYHRNLNINTILLDKNYNPIISNFACATNFVGNNLFGQFGNPEFSLLKCKIIKLMMDLKQIYLALE